jgi:hypothetical protein
VKGKYNFGKQGGKPLLGFDCSTTSPSMPDTTYKEGIFSATGEKELEQALNDLGRDIDEFASLSSYSPSDTRPLISGGDASMRRNLW